MPTHSLQELEALLPQPVLAACVTESHNKGSRLFRAGDKPAFMFFVVSGEVVLERPGLQGVSVILQRTRRGFVSEASLQSPRYHCDGHVVAKSHIVRLPIAEILQAHAVDSGFSGRWIMMLNKEVKRLRLQCERLSLPRVQDRILHLLETEGSDGLFEVQAGVKSLAAELGVTHEALYRGIYALENQGRIERRPGYLKLSAAAAKSATSPAA